MKCKNIVDFFTHYIYATYDSLEDQYIQNIGCNYLLPQFNIKILDQQLGFAIKQDIISKPIF